MDHQNSPSGSRPSPGGNDGFRQAGATAGSTERTSDVVQRVAEKATRAIGHAGSTVTHQVKEMLDRQVSAGAEMVGDFAHSAQRAADELHEKAPQAAGLVRGIADRLEDYSDDLRDQSVDQLAQRASDFTRRQPGLVFGLAALAGFLALRTLKASPSADSPSIQPSQRDQYSNAGDFRGF